MRNEIEYEKEYFCSFDFGFDDLHWLSNERVIQNSIRILNKNNRPVGWVEEIGGAGGTSVNPNYAVYRVTNNDFRYWRLLP